MRFVTSKAWEIASGTRWIISLRAAQGAPTLVHENGSVNSCVGGLDLASSLAPADAHARSVEASV